MSTFASGVASGDVTATSVLLWTRATPLGVPTGGNVDLDWTLRAVGHDDRRAGTVVARSADDRTVHVEVVGLSPDTTYEYSFQFGDESVTGITRTLPTSADRFRFAVACCSRWGWPGFDQFGAIADEEPDLLIHLGDAIYETGEVAPNGDSTEPPWDCLTLSDYRRRYHQSRSHPALRRLLACIPMMAVWDDHEVVDNAPRPGDAARRRAGQQAWADWMPSRRTTEPGPLDRSLTIDGLVDLLLVDTRFAGRTPSDVDGPGAAGSAPGSLLDDDQWRRLGDAVVASTSPWFVVANQVQVGPMTLGARPALSWPPWRRVVNPDQWDGYPGDRARLYELLRAATGRPVVLSGDLHSAWSRTLSDGSASFAHEFTCPSISGITYAEAVREHLPLPASLLHRWLRWCNDGIDHLDLRRHGYLICDVTADHFTATIVSAGGGRHVVELGRDD